MSDINKKGHDISVQNLVIHQVKKDAGKDVSTTILKCADKLLPIRQKEINFIADIKKSFANQGKTYGVFEEQNELTIFENNLQKNKNQEIDFLEMTLKLMDYYKRILPVQASGSFIVFAEYLNTNNQNNYLLVLTINNKDSYFFTEELTLNEIQSVDLGKIDVAAQINLTYWDNFKKGDEDVKTYLSFKSGLKDLSKYFLTFIGCENKTTKSEGSKRLLKALSDYFEEKGFSSELKDALSEEIKSYCQKCERQGDGASLLDIANLIDQDNPEDFMNFANSEIYQVNPIISIDNQVIKLLTRTLYKSSSKDLLIEFDNDLINKRIFLGEDNSLVIKNIPQELIAQIKRHI